MFGGLVGGLNWRGQKCGFWGPGTLATGRPAGPSEPARAKNAVFGLISGGPLGGLIGGLTFWPKKRHCPDRACSGVGRRCLYDPGQVGRVKYEV